MDILIDTSQKLSRRNKADIEINIDRDIDNLL